VTNLSTRIQIFTACCLFILTGLAVIPYLGIQNDEALFASPLFIFNPKEFCFAAFHRQIPLMVMTYIGTLKSAIYIPIFKIFGGNVWSTRVPMLLTGTATIFFFFKLARRVAGPVAAAIAGFLLATDPIFMLTDTVDWGPVALSQFFLVTGCYLIVRFGSLSSNSMRDLALGFILFGLGLWNKALFLWILAGLGAGSVLLIPEIRKLWTWKRAIVATVAFLFGASPFVMFNIRQRNATLSSSAHFNSAAIAMAKFPVVEATLDGSGLLGYFTVEDFAAAPQKPASSVRGRVAVWVHDKFGDHRHDGLLYASGIALLLVPLWWRRRAAWFSMVFMAVVWVQMAFTADAGAAVHHVVLLWPFPHLLIGIALASLPWRTLIWAGAAVLIAMNLLVLDKYIADFERNGAGQVYSDAFFGLSRAVPAATDEDHRVWIMDWGMLNSLALTHEGRLNLRSGDPPFYTDHPDEAQEKDIEYMLHDEGALFVGYMPAFEVNRGVRGRVEARVALEGMAKRVRGVIRDSNGREVFEIYQIDRSPAR
jgi:hypothetical protein